MTTIHVATTSDDKYVPHAAAMLESLRSSNPSVDLEVHFLCATEPTGRFRPQLARMANDLQVRLHWVEVPSGLVRGLPHRDYLPQVVWYRIFMPELLPELKRVLYIDADVIAVDSIVPLWQTDLRDYYFAAVTNVVPGQYQHRARELGLPGPEHYFNAGIMLWNLEVLRKEAFTSGLLDYARANIDKLRWLEQDAMNALFWKRRLPLHPRWNCQNGIYYSSWGCRLLDRGEVSEALARPALVHFEGGSFAKPWHYLSTHPLRRQYLRHRARTPWPMRLPDGLSVRNILKKNVPQPLLRFLRRFLRKI